MNKKENARTYIRKRYADVATKKTSNCCSGSSCCCGDTTLGANEASLQLGYNSKDMENVPDESNMGLGCGNPVAIAEIKEGNTVLDLGCGGGFDCFLAREKVGERGYVIGVDMTPEMIQLSRKNAEESGYTNMDFRLGEIEHLPVGDNTIDFIISNCVINLSIDKEQVFKEAFRVLKPEGKLVTSDVVATSKLPKDIKDDLSLVASCVGGAEYVEDLRKILENAGFKDIQLTPKANSSEIIKSWGLGKNVEDFVASYIIKAIKP